MGDWLHTLGNASAQSLGLVVAMALTVATWFLLPLQDKRLVRLPVGLLITHALFRAVFTFFAETTALSRIIGLIALGALLAAIGRSAVLLVLEVILHRRLATPVPKIIRDIVQGVVYFVVALAILRAVGFEPGQILTTSAVLTAVIGLSLQETLGNLVAGLAVQVQRPFDVGDWVQFDSDAAHIGRVVEVNWRATKLVTLDEVEVIVPNGTLAKAPLTNFSKPTKLVRRSVRIQAPYDVAPKRVHQTILRAVADVPGVAQDPAPSVVTSNFMDSGIEYWVRVFTNQFGKRDAIDGMVRDRIWYAFQRAGIAIPFPHRVIDVHQISDESRARDTDRKTDKKLDALERVDFLRVIEPEQRRQLALSAKTRLFSPGEVIVKQGDDSQELFIIQRGEVVIVLENSESSTEVTRLQEGEFFGEMALVTGERRKATVKAARECELIGIGHDAFERVLHESPDVVVELSRVLAERQIQLDETAAQADMDRSSVVEEKSSLLIAKIKKFFSLR